MQAGTNILSEEYTLYHETHCNSSLNNLIYSTLLRSDLVTRDVITTDDTRSSQDVVCVRPASGMHQHPGMVPVSTPRARQRDPDDARYPIPFNYTCPLWPHED